MLKPSQQWVRRDELSFESIAICMHVVVVVHVDKAIGTLPRTRTPNANGIHYWMDTEECKDQSRYNHLIVPRFVRKPSGDRMYNVWCILVELRFKHASPIAVWRMRRIVIVVSKSRMISRTLLDKLLWYDANWNQRKLTRINDPIGSCAIAKPSIYSDRAEWPKPSIYSDRMPTCYIVFAIGTMFATDNGITSRSNGS